MPNAATQVRSGWIVPDFAFLCITDAWNSRPTLGGERFLTDREVSARLKVSRRTLQDYRNNGIIAYYQLGGKILYKESDIESMLAANYREAFR